jgi:hypothetical protein
MLPTVGSGCRWLVLACILTRDGYIAIGFDLLAYTLIEARLLIRNF